MAEISSSGERATKWYNLLNYSYLAEIDVKHREMEFAVGGGRVRRDFFTPATLHTILVQSFKSQDLSTPSNLILEVNGPRLVLTPDTNAIMRIVWNTEKAIIKINE